MTRRTNCPILRVMTTDLLSQADDLDDDAMRLRWLGDALEDLIAERARIGLDYEFADDTTEAARRELPALKAKIAELKDRAERLRESRYEYTDTQMRAWASGRAL